MGTKERGCYLSIPIAILLGLLAVGALVAVGLITWYETPRPQCPARTNESNCNLYVNRYGKDEVCKAPKPIKKEEKEEEKEKVTGLRLNKTMIPYHYDIELWPLLYGDFGFNGSVKITVMVTERTEVIVLHVDQLTVHNDTIDIRNSAADSMLNVDRVEEDKPRQFYKIYMKDSLNPGRNYTLSMSFNGTLIHPDWVGFYRSSYVERNKTKWMATTQFQRTHARRAFPCFDEPSFKATFTLKLIRQWNFTTISNMPQKSSTPYSGSRDWYLDEYERSVIMPTYLVAFVFSQFDYVETGTNRVPIRIWSRPTFINYTKFARQHSYGFVDAFEKWTGIEYTLPKMDQIAIPDYRAGAMENWGLITYRESALLYNSYYSDNADRRWVGSVIAHEIAHMWFGNLVTCDWWDDTWLNEGFATYFGDLVAMETVMPEYEMDEFFIRRVMYIMNKDGYSTSQPVFVADLEHHDDLLKAFDIITYYKGGSILRMMKYFLTEKTFRGGIQKYLEKYKFSTTVHEDLYKELQKQAVADGTVSWDPSRTNISDIMDTWIEQKNFPIVTLSDPMNGRVNVTQTRFLYDKEEEEGKDSKSSEEEKEPEKDYLWHIYLTYASKADLMNGNDQYKWIHKDRSIELMLPNVQDNDLILVNLRMQGFYRVKYGPKTWEAILNQLMTNHTIIPVENRAEIMDDAFQLAAAQELEELEALRTTQYLIKEMDYLPFATFRGRINYYFDMFYGLPTYDELQTYMISRVLPMYNLSGWNVNETADSHLDRYTRIITTAEACYRDYKPCVDEAKALYEQFMNNPKQDPTPPDLRPVVYCTAVSRGGIREWDFLLSQYETNLADMFIAYYNSTLKNALSCASAPHVVRRYLNYALSKNSTELFTSIVGKRHAKDIAWNYINEHWDDFEERNTSISQSAILKTVTSSWNSEGDLRKLESFMAAHDDEKLEKTYGDIKKTIKKNMEWLETNLSPIHDWLVSVNYPQASNVTMPSTQGRRRKRSISTDINPMKRAFHDLRSEF